MPKLFRRAALGASTLMVLSACGSSTAPAPLTSSQIARHIDSLLVATSSNSPRYTLMYVAEIGPAYGVTPSEIMVTTHSGRQKWHGYVWGDLPVADARVVSETMIVAYSDYALTDVLVAEIYYWKTGTPTSVGIQIATSDTLYTTVATGSQNISLVSKGAACTLTPGLVNITTSPHPPCSLATYFGGLSWSLNGAGTEFQTISIAPQSFTGLTWQ